MERSTITFRLHADAGERLSAAWLDERRNDRVTIAIGQERYTGIVTKVAAEGDEHGAVHIDVTMWMESEGRVECEDQDHAGPTGPVLFTLDELGQFVLWAVREREAARAAR